MGSGGRGGGRSHRAGELCLGCLAIPLTCVLNQRRSSHVLFQQSASTYCTQALGVVDSRVTQCVCAHSPVWGKHAQSCPSHAGKSRHRNGPGEEQFTPSERGGDSTEENSACMWPRLREPAGFLREGPRKPPTFTLVLLNLATGRPKEF